MTDPMAQSDLDSDPAHPPEFASAECINLVTRRRNGAEVATPVWFVPWNDKVCLRTATRFGKVKRLRNDPLVRYAACDWDGKVSGPWLEGRAELILATDARATAIDRLLDARYGERRAEMNRLMQAEGMEPIFIAITADAP
ncbi:MAG: PPOX class F420-dependent oxidoreductase [Gammaproteobacteria bacterium]|nr:PPOX class F420-dependent oxidoreductase [Gammaproteobacteria bacterium]MBK7730810.1 PPOX class F420-dependent oxidoreductase [Gammaproteobacteria bacterium]MBK8306353.1 PPOX class F420-dependent oxidoreductase [Gammaproteobacteria bacterium]MBP6053128.1 PPOX class F420-dependent oxidoreductase [Pseudomonadales bacterium]